MGRGAVNLVEGMVTFPVQLVGHPIKTVEGMAGMPMEYVERFRSGNWSERVTAGIEIAAMVGMTAESAAKLKKNIKNEKLAMEAARREAANNRKNGIPDGCFTAGTSVLTKEGLKTIENIQSGEYVLAEEVESGTREYKKVIRTTIRKTNKIIHLVIAKEEIETTGNHPFWLPEQGWVPAEKLQLYDEVELSDGTHALIENLWHEKTGEEIPVYNMEVEDFHTYYIAKTGVLVHNDGGCGHSGGKVRISSNGDKVSNFNGDLPNRRQALNEAKDRAGIPRSQQPNRQWKVGDDINMKGHDTANYRYDTNLGSHGRYYEYDIPNGKRVIVEHTNDGVPHVHAGQPKDNPNSHTYDFKMNRYQKIDGPDGDHHIYYKK